MPDGEAPIVAGIDGGRLRSFVDRIRNVDGEIDELRGALAEIYGEAAAEFDKKALKIVVRRLRRQRADIDAEDFLILEYEHALGIGDRGEPPLVIRVEDMPDLARGTGARARETAPPNAEARKAGRRDGHHDCRDNAGRWPSGEYGHADYELGWQDGHAERVDGATARDGAAT